MDQQFIHVFKNLKWHLHRFFLQKLAAGHFDKAKDAADLVQETAALALPYSRKEAYRDRLQDLLWVVAWNVLSRYKRKVRRQVRFIRVMQGLKKVDHTDPIGAFLNKDRWRNLYKNMDPVTRQICQMHCAGYPHAEIAAHLGMTESSVKMRLQRLKQ